MPRLKSFKTVCLEIIFFISMFVLVGHLCVNFWERYIFQTEISNMKCSLHSLKETIYNIGHAYDNLYKELKGLAHIAEKKHPGIYLNKNEPIIYNCKKYDSDPSKHSTLNQGRGHGIQTEAMIKSINDISIKHSPIKFNKTTQGFNINKVLPNLAQTGKNATTITRYPPRSTGISADTVKYKLEEYPADYNYFRYRDICSGPAHTCYDDRNTCNNCKVYNVTL